MKHLISYIAYITHLNATRKMKYLLSLIALCLMLSVSAQNYEYAELSVSMAVKGKNVVFQAVLTDENEQKVLPEVVQGAGSAKNGLYMTVLNEVLRDGKWEYVEQFRESPKIIYFLRREIEKSN